MKTKEMVIGTIELGYSMVMQREREWVKQYQVSIEKDRQADMEEYDNSSYYPSCFCEYQ